MAVNVETVTVRAPTVTDIKHGQKYKSKKRRIQSGNP